MAFGWLTPMFGAELQGPCIAQAAGFWKVSQLTLKYSRVGNKDRSVFCLEHTGEVSGRFCKKKKETYVIYLETKLCPIW